LGRVAVIESEIVDKTGLLIRAVLPDEGAFIFGFVNEVALIVCCQLQTCAFEKGILYL